MASLKTQEDLKGWLVGCDKDIGGFSEAHLEITKQGTGNATGAVFNKQTLER